MLITTRNSTLWFLFIIFADESCADLQHVCPQGGPKDKEIQEAGTKQCIAHCLDLIGPTTASANQKTCNYNRNTGKSQGCGAISNLRANKKVVMCDSGPAAHGLKDELGRLCDFVQYEIFEFNTTSDVTWASPRASNIMSRAHNIRKVGGKIIGTFSLWETAENLMRISSSPNLREKFSASILDVVEQLQLDGLFLKWMWPGCPMSGNCKPVNPHKSYTVELISAISKQLKRSGKIFFMYLTISIFSVSKLDDYYSEIMPYVDYFVIETNNQAGHWMKKPDFNFNLKTTKDGVKFLTNIAKNPGFSKKFMITFDLSILSFELKSPTKDNRIYSVEQDPDGKKYPKFLMLPEWCKLARPGSGYKVFLSNETQNYAVKEDHLFVFDDVQSLKEKIDWVKSIGIGVNLVGTFADDQENVCGCGDLPFIKTVAQLLKSNDCDPIPCF